METADSPVDRARWHAAVKIGAVILAAGSSSRLGQPKQLLTYRGTTLVRRSAEAAAGAGCSPVIVVLGSKRDRIAAGLDDPAIEILWNEDWARGLGSSLRTGVTGATDCDALVILACDQPHVDAALLRRLFEAHQRTGQPIVASAYAGTLGVPAFFARSYFAALLSLPDEHGAKSIIATHPDEVAPVDFPAGAIDIDTAQDYEKASDKLL